MITSADISSLKWLINESITFDACKPKKKKNQMKKMKNKTCFE